MRLIVFLLLFIPGCVAAQYSQQTYILADSLETDTAFHSPKKATIMSAIVPGLGQAYNKKYWKIPIVYAALGVTTYFMIDNNKQYKYYRDNLIAELDDDSTTINQTSFTSSQLDLLQDTYRRWRDLSGIILGLGYVLNLVDANVDAHLFRFDVSDDLSFKFHPYVQPSAGINTGVRLAIKF